MALAQLVHPMMIADILKPIGREVDTWGGKNAAARMIQDQGMTIYKVSDLDVSDLRVHHRSLHQASGESAADFCGDEIGDGWGYSRLLLPVVPAYHDVKASESSRISKERVRRSYICVCWVS